VDAAGEIFVRRILAGDGGGGGHRCSVGAMRNGNTTREGRRGEVWLSFVLGQFRFGKLGGTPPMFCKE
jgi:hypothetical protein